MSRSYDRNVAEDEYRVNCIYIFIVIQRDIKFIEYERKNPFGKVDQC